MITQVITPVWKACVKYAIVNFFMRNVKYKYIWTCGHMYLLALKSNKEISLRTSGSGTTYMVYIIINPC